MNAPERIDVGLSERALFLRVDRRLRKQGERLNRCNPNSRACQQLGRYFITDLSGQKIVAVKCDLELLGVDLSCLRPWEFLEQR